MEAMAYIRGEVGWRYRQSPPLDHPLGHVAAAHRTPARLIVSNRQNPVRPYGEDDENWSGREDSRPFFDRF
jgi:hypothetical protein